MIVVWIDSDLEDVKNDTEFEIIEASNKINDIKISDVYLFSWMTILE